MKNQKKQRNNVNGWLLINKPVGVNSTKVVTIIKRVFNAKKVGHAGTLDPLAEGVLPIALGEATKTIQYCMDATKEYEFTIKWGEATSTDDAEGEVIATSDKIPDMGEIIAALPEFIGEIEQIPPAFSAIKINGERSYDLARRGENVQLKSRKVIIHEAEWVAASGAPCSSIARNDANTSTFRIKCSKGTYIRSLARDLAESLGTKGHVTMLKRTKVGGFCIKNAILLDMFDNKVYKPEFSELLLPVEQVLDDIPVLTFNSEQSIALRHGQKVEFAANDLKNGDIAVIKSGEKLIAIGEFEEGIIKPSRVFNI